MIKDSVLNKKIIPVWLPIPSFQPYCYILPDEMKTSPGSLVRVPLGSRELIGLVSDDVVPVFSSSIKLRVVSKVFNFPPINQELLEFVRFVSSYTLAPLGLVARMVLKISISFEEDMNEEGLLYSGLIPEHITSARSRVIELLMRTPRVWPRSQLLREAGVSSRVLERLKAQGVLKSINLAYQSVISAATASVDKPVLLEKAQRQAANLLQAAVLEKRFSVSLLDGVTGSGKTEVYFEAIAETLQKDLQVLILVPEISLTPQLLDRFASRFGHAPSEWHSDVPRLQRNRIWSQVAQGGIRVVAGARSALFLPFQKLGLIIVDEEHDSAYKQEDKIFYNARDMAVARGSIANIPVILASATPSLESYVNVKRGRYRYIHLSSRFSNAAMPHLKAIDLRVNRPSSGHFLSPILLRAMRDVLEGGKQSLLFLNRRGYAPLTLCRFCGHRFSCPNCSTWLVEHRSSSSLQCHHCNYHKIIPEICPECGLSEHLVACGPGIERIAEEVKEEFSHARILVLSTDTVRSVKQIRFKLESIKQGHVDIVIGTQLIAKGHHFPDITLVGVIDADIGLSNGDMRAAERTFQLLSQVTGRAGRTHSESIALIQTYQPDHPVMQALIANDRTAFLTREIEEREANQFPPFGRFAALIVSSRMRSKAESYARILRSAAPEAPGITVLGPAEAPLALIRGRYRFRLLIQGSPHIHIQSFIRCLLKKASAPCGLVHLQVDIDPQSFL